MVGNDKKAFTQDTRGVSVIFGTLLLILITIIAASSVAYMISTTQKQAMDLESHKTAVENENLKIVSIEPTENSSVWTSIDLKILNFNTQDSRISAIRLNDGYFLNFKAYDDAGDFDVYKDYPAVYNANHRIEVPERKSKIIHLNFSNIVVEGHELIKASSLWTNNSKDFTYQLNEHPWKAYNGVEFSYYLNNTTSSTTCIQENNFTINNESQQITFFGNLNGGKLTNTTDYEIFYTVDFDSYAGSDPSANEPIKIEIITSYINVFKELFVPPMPIAELNYKVDYIPDGNGTPTPKNYLILDASDSMDSDGFITDYKWTVWQGSDKYNLSGKVVRYDETAISNLTIDLKITDDDGMTSRLSQVSGNLTIL